MLNVGCEGNIFCWWCVSHTHTRTHGHTHTHTQASFLVDENSSCSVRELTLLEYFVLYTLKMLVSVHNTAKCEFFCHCFFFQNAKSICLTKIRRQNTAVNGFIITQQNVSMWCWVVLWWTKKSLISDDLLLKTEENIHTGCHLMIREYWNIMKS